MKRRKTPMKGVLLGVILTIAALLSSAFLPGGQVDLSQTIPTPTPTMPPEEEPAVQVVISEEYIQRVIELEFESQEDFTNPVIDLRAPNRVLVTVDTFISGFRIRPTATLELSVVNGEIRTEISSLSVGTLAVPRSLVAQSVRPLESQLETELNRMTESLQSAILRLDTIEVADELMVANMSISE
jgi:uncharacterized protein YpmS